MEFFKRLSEKYGLEVEDGTLNRCVSGYMKLQREVIKAHISAQRTCFPDSKESDDDLALAYVLKKFPGGKTFSEDYREVLVDMFENPQSDFARKCEQDWLHQKKDCTYLHDRIRGFSCPVITEADLNEDYIAGRVIYNRLIEKENIADTYHLPGILDKVA